MSKTKIHNENISYGYQCIKSHSTTYKEKKEILFKNQKHSSGRKCDSLFLVHAPSSDQKLDKDTGEINNIIM